MILQKYLKGEVNSWHFCASSPFFPSSFENIQLDSATALQSFFVPIQVVKEKQAAADVMFEPLHHIIDLVRNYGVVIPEESLVQLQELPEKWANTKRLSVTAKQQVMRTKQGSRMMYR